MAKEIVKAKRVQNALSTQNVNAMIQARIAQNAIQPKATYKQALQTVLAGLEITTDENCTPELKRAIEKRCLEVVKNSEVRDLIAKLPNELTIGK
jgi:hypothetical protein